MSRRQQWEARVMRAEGRLAPAGVSPAEFLGLSEPARLAAIKAAATAPASCGPDVPVAPARGAFAVFAPREMVPGSTLRTRPAGYQGRDATRQADVWDRMEEAARKAHQRHGAGAPFVPPFTPGQVAMGRRYRDLIERHEAGGVRCSSMERGSGGGSGGSFIDAFVAEGIEIERMRGRIGARAALVVRRVRPSARGAGARGIITDRMLVDAVCLRGRTLSEAATEAGWAKDAKLIARLREALAGALDRMQGYGLASPQKGA